MHSIALQLGPLRITAYALMLTLAFLVGTLLAARRARRWRVPREDVVSVANVIIIASLVGARLLFVVEHWTVFSQDVVSVLYIWRGGFSYHGGLFGALAATLWWIRTGPVSVREMLDIFAPSVALGFVLVRIGCFLNGCCFGTPTQMPWGVVFPPDSPAGAVYGNVKIHPTQVYEALSALLTFCILLGVERRYHSDIANGVLFLLLLALSSVWRFATEVFRSSATDPSVGRWLTEVQAYCGGVLLISLIMIGRGARSPGRRRRAS